MLKKDKIKSLVPSYFNPRTNTYWKAILEANGIEDDKIVEQIAEANNQIFVASAEQKYLDSLGDNVAVFRPLEINLSDDNFRLLIPYLSFYPKQVKTLIINILDVFYGPLYSRYNLQTQSVAPFNLTGDECLVFKKENDIPKTVTKQFVVDGGTDGYGTIRVNVTSGLYIGQKVYISDDNSLTISATVTNLTKNIIFTDQDTSDFTVNQNSIVFFDSYQYVTFKASDFETSGAATTEEIVNAINSIAVGVTASSTYTNTAVVLRTNTPGLKGEIQVLGGTANAILNFPTSGTSRLKVQVDEINPNEVVIRIPSTVPALRRTLIGASHIHASSALASPYIGSFIFSPSEVDYSVQKIQTTLNQTIQKGLVYTQISVSDSSSFPNQTGFLMLGFGTDKMEYPIKIIGRPNNSTLLIDPSYVFQKSHNPGEAINIMTPSSTVPRVTGNDYAVYLTGIEAARQQLQEIIRDSVVAMGVRIRWIIDYPSCGKK